MRASKILLLIAAVIISGIGWAKSAGAQQVRRYQPSRPTVSPYLNLGRFNNSGLPNYYALVRPQKLQRQVNLQGQLLQRQQAASLRRLEMQTRVQPKQMPAAVTGTGSQFLRLGDRAVFRDTLQFYPAVELRR